MYNFFFSLYSHIVNPCIRGHGACSLVNRETLLELRNELRLDALPVTTIDCSGIRTRDSPSANRVF